MQNLQSAILCVIHFSTGVTLSSELEITHIFAHFNRVNLHHICITYILIIKHYIGVVGIHNSSFGNENKSLSFDHMQQSWYIWYPNPAAKS